MATAGAVARTMTRQATHALAVTCDGPLVDTSLRPYQRDMEPLPAEWPAVRGRDAYLAANGFTLAGYEEKWTQASFLAIDFAVPNTKAHASAIRLHDLHHVATGFGTDLAGEAEISAWELRGGLRGVGLYVASIVMSGAFMGLFVAPRRTWRAWQAGRDARPLWTLGISYNELITLSVEELRARVGAPARGVAFGNQGLHKNAPRGHASTGAEMQPGSG
jgi:hypothetical protein